MNVVATSIPGLLVIEPKLVSDQRGFFTELYNSSQYHDAGIVRNFMQDNLSRSHRNVLRGLHIQNPNSQGKLVSVLKGTILDVAVDTRRGSPTFGRHVKIELSDKNRRQFWLPRGFAHGFRVLSDSADVFYKCDAIYSPTNEFSLKWNDPQLGIDWGIADPQLSPKDREGVPLSELFPKLPLFSDL